MPGTPSRARGSVDRRGAVGPEGDARPDQLHDPEGPRAREEAVDAREHAAGREPEHEPLPRLSSAYITIMNVTAQTPARLPRSLLAGIPGSRTLARAPTLPAVA